MPIRIGLVDDKQINRQTVKDKIVRYEELELCVEARNGQDFLEQMQTLNPKPDLVLMDLEMPILDGIETIRLASAAYPDVRFIVLTVFEDNDKIFEAIRAGASGYLLKEDTAVNIVDAITNVIEHNGIPMSPSIARSAMELLRQMPANPSASSTTTAAHHSILTDRELEILKELVRGKNYKSIGESLFISPLTVRKHIANIYDKLHVNSRAQVVNIAHKNKWV